MAAEKKKLTLADKINSLISVAPTNFESDDEADGTEAKVVDKLEESDSEDDLHLPSIRRQIDTLDNDPRYAGRKVSSEDGYDSSSNIDTDGGDEDEDGSDVESDEGKGESDDMEMDEERSKDDQSEEEDVDDTNPLYRKRDLEDPLKNMVADSLGEAEKGHCVKQQLKLWDNVLEMRIHLQKCLTTSNNLPQFDVYKELPKEKEFIKSKRVVEDNLIRVLDNLSDLQDRLLNNYPETKNLFSGNVKSKVDDDEDDAMDEEICSDTEEEEEEANDKRKEEVNDEDNESAKKKRRKLDDYVKLFDAKLEKYTPYCYSVIQKWNDKTRIASGKADKSTSQPIVKQIEFLLKDKSNLIRKSQLKRSEYKIIGKESLDVTDEDGRGVQEYDEEIYDDNDFYLELLKEVLKEKTSNTTDPIQLSRQWIELQNMRNKMKRNIDPRATKGRKIRYNVHNRLVNFMAPITVDDTWSDAMKTELYNSLFGKITSVNNQSGVTTV